MRKTLLVFLLFPFSLLAQTDHKNGLKVNLVAGVSKIYSVQYERMLGTNFSFNTTAFYRPKTSVPLGQEFDAFVKKHGAGVTGVDFEHVFMDESQIGVKGLSPELRYYFGYKKSRWFLGAFGQYEVFDASIPASLEVSLEGRIVPVKIPVNFDIETISGGLLLGKQFRLGKRVVLDFVILGPHFGRALKLTGLVENELLNRLEESDQVYLKEKIIDRFQLSEDYFNVTVAGETAEIKAHRNVPYLGIRGAGLNFGFYF